PLPKGMSRPIGWTTRSVRANVCFRSIRITSILIRRLPMPIAKKVTSKRRLRSMKKRRLWRISPARGWRSPAKMGRQEDARRVLNQRIEKSRQQYVAADSIAAVYVALGDKEEAFRWLERAFDEHSAPMSIQLTCHPKFRALRSDPRFADLLRRMGVDPDKALARQNKP